MREHPVRRATANNSIDGEVGDELAGDLKELVFIVGRVVVSACPRRRGTLPESPLLSLSYPSTVLCKQRRRRDP